MFWGLRILQVKNDINLNIDRSTIFKKEIFTHCIYLECFFSTSSLSRNVSITKSSLLFSPSLESSAQRLLTKLKTSGHRRDKNSPMATLLGNPNFPKCRESKATESVSNNPNEATVTLSCLKHGFCYLENS